MGNKDLAKKDCEGAVAEWNAVGVVKFQPAKTFEDADLKIMFDNLSPLNDRVFDGRGGMLAESTKSRIAFDMAEKWVTSDQKSGGLTRTFGLQEVLVHELGHVLGM